ncbi:SRPBCC family protein [Emticicia fontis]
MSTTKNSRDIRASVEVLYQAFTDPKALEVWMAPGEMTGKVHQFDLREGGGYEMSLYYPESEKSPEGQSYGKTSNNEDKYSARFIELKPNEKVVCAIVFDSTDENNTGEMIMDVTLTPKGKDTTVTIVFKNIPLGIKPEDNEKGTEMSLEKLAKYVE